MSAERQWLMTFIVVSRRGVMGTSQDPLSALWFWPQEGITRRILSRTSYCYIIRRNRRYHPYKRPGKYSSGPCKCCSLPVYLDYRYFSVSVRRYLDDTEASTEADTDKEIECLAVDNHISEEIESSTEDSHLSYAQMTYDVEITITKTLEMTTPELDKPTSDDVSNPNNTDTPVTDSMADWDLNLVSDSDLQDMRKTECETTVADLGSTAQSKTDTDETDTSFDHKQVKNVTSEEDQFTTTNVSTLETPDELQQISQQQKSTGNDTETAATNEIDEKQHENVKGNKEDDCCKMNPSEEDILDYGQSFHVSFINHLEKTKEETCNKKSVEKQIMDELHQTDGTAESTVRCIIPPKPYKKRMSAAMFFQKEITSQSETSNTSTCTDCNPASSSTSQVTGLTPNKTRKSYNQQISNTDHELHSNNSLCIWLRKSSSSSEPYIASKNLSDEERLKMRKRRFGTSAQNEEKSTRNLQRGVTGSVPHATTKRRKIRLNRF